MAKMTSTTKAGMRPTAGHFSRSGLQRMAQSLSLLAFLTLLCFGSFLPTFVSAQGDQVYRLVLLDRSENAGMAEAIFDSVVDFEDVDKVDHPGNTFSVLLGAFSTEQEARELESQLTQIGFIVYDVRQFDDPRAAQPLDEEFERQLQILRGEATPDATPTPQVIVTPTPQPIEATPTQDGLQLRLNNLIAAAGEAETAGELQTAINHWEDVQNLATAGSSEATLAAESLQRLREANRERTASESAEGGPPMGLIIGGILGLLVVGGALFFLLGRKKSPSKSTSTTSAASSLTPLPVATPTPVATSATPAPQDAAPPVQPTASQQPMVEVAPTDRIRPGTVSHAAPPPASTDTVSIADIDAVPAPVPVPESGPQGQDDVPNTGVPEPVSGSSDGLKLDFLFEEEGSQESESAPQGTAKKESTTDFLIPPKPDSAEAHSTGDTSHATPYPEPAQPNQQSSYYEQSFNDEEVGSAPKNWRGEYEYATLSVVEPGKDNTGRCLKFEKSKGVGSAYYSCKFPDTGGRIGVEFDLRCDDKNKYLLGFYLEKDEDFRQSIHTIVHRTNSKAEPTLRIQNESTPYQLGTWTHIKFEIDLPRHILDTWVDDKVVLTGSRLTSCPKVINTLSIRDNLATTGTLLIDNIRIYRVS